MIQKITSINNQLIKNIYHDTHNDNKSNLIVIESFKIVNELAKRNYPIKYVLCTQKWLDKNKTFFDKSKVEIIVCNQEIINKISFVKSELEIILIVELKLDNFSLSPNNYYVILDEIKDPNNMANIIRTCVSFNCLNLYISNNSVSLTNDKVIRGTMGSIFNIKVNYYNDLKKLINELKDNHITTIATCLDRDSIKLNEFKLDTKEFAFILGNESKGLNTNIIDLCDYKIFINMKNIDSLNVSSAFAIIAF